MKNIWFICHTPSQNTRAMGAALVQGAQETSTAIKINAIAPLACTAEHILKADAIVILTTENLGYMAGTTKDWFDRIYYPLEGRKQGLSYYSVIRAGMDGTGTKRAITSICSGLGWHEAQPTLLCQGLWQDDFIQQCYELGQLAATSLELGII